MTLHLSLRINFPHFHLSAVLLIGSNAYWLFIFGIKEVLGNIKNKIKFMGSGIEIDDILHILQQTTMEWHHKFMICDVIYTWFNIFRKIPILLTASHFEFDLFFGWSVNILYSNAYWRAWRTFTV